jgi:hypothetical protein
MNNMNIFDYKEDQAKKKMRILVACEESQAVTIELRNLGHEAYSCDIEPCSGDHPEWHILGDVLKVLKPHDMGYGIKEGINFATRDGVYRIIGKRWDMIIAFPPCTYLTNAGTRHFSRRVNPEWKVLEREAKREKAAEFFMSIWNADCDRIAIENPVGYMSKHFRKYDQIIQPYYFGDNAKKRTCLWLKNLPLLQPTEMLPEPKPDYIDSTGKATHYTEAMRGIKGGQKERAKARSKTFPGIAKAMANQWAGPCN